MYRSTITKPDTKLEKLERGSLPTVHININERGIEDNDLSVYSSVILASNGLGPEDVARKRLDNNPSLGTVETISALRKDVEKLGFDVIENGYGEGVDKAHCSIQANLSKWDEDEADRKWTALALLFDAVECEESQ